MTRLDQTDRVRLGERLRLARTRADSTQEQAAQAIGVARTTMVAIEAGDRQVKPEELVKLASLYRVSTNALLRETAVHVDLVAQFRRTMSSTHDEKSAADAVALLHKLATSFVELEQRLHRQLPVHYPPERPLGRGGLEIQAEDIALELRSYLGLGTSPIPDLLSLVELELGIRVFVRGVASSIGGIFAYHPEVGGCILLNAKHPEERQMWSLAHDLGHFMTQRNVLETCEIRDGVKPPTERFADYFAAAFLMPASAIRRRVAELRDAQGRFTPRDLILLARRFHVSIEAMCRRLEQLKLLKDGSFERLKRQGLSRQTVREVLGDEPSERMSRPPPRLSMLAAEAYGMGFLSEGQVADMLAMDRVAVRELLDSLGRDDLGDLEVVP